MLLITCELNYLDLNLHLTILVAYAPCLNFFFLNSCLPRCFVTSTASCVLVFLHCYLTVGACMLVLDEWMFCLFKFQYLFLPSRIAVKVWVWTPNSAKTNF